MTKKQGYYIATVPGCADGDVVVYWNGKEFYTVGSEEGFSPDKLLMISEEPINTGDAKGNFTSGEEWLGGSK